MQKMPERRARIANLTLQLEAADRNRAEQADLAIKVFELSQSLTATAGWGPTTARSAESSK